MPKRLLVLRHAKSDWSEEDLPDHERPLNERGKAEAPLVGKFLRRSDRVPDLIISSTARRARKTAQRVARACRYSQRILLYPELYGASSDLILDVIHSLPGKPVAVLLVGHNPGLESFTEQMTGESFVLSTSTLVDLHVNIDDWQQLACDGSAQLLELWSPRGDQRDSDQRDSDQRDSDQGGHGEAAGAPQGA